MASLRQAVASAYPLLGRRAPAGQIAVMGARREVTLPAVGMGSGFAAFDPSHNVALSSGGDGALGIVVEVAGSLCARSNADLAPRTGLAG